MIVIFHCRTVSPSRALKWTSQRFVQWGVDDVVYDGVDFTDIFCCPDLVGVVLEGRDDMTAQRGTRATHPLHCWTIGQSCNFGSL